MKSIATGLILILALAVPASADPLQGKGQGKGKGQGEGQGKGHGQDHGQNKKDASASVPPGHAKQAARRNVVWVPRDRDIIVNYYRTNTSNLPPGLAKRGGDLPPGLARQLARNGTLPPGLQNRVQPLPVDLERQLPPLPYGYRRVIIGDDLLIYDPQTQAIADIMRGVFTLVRR